MIASLLGFAVIGSAAMGWRRWSEVHAAVTVMAAVRARDLSRMFIGFSIIIKVLQ
ncbi:MAG: hypothetical protein DHS20C11_35720 [Lysobacteraceae bacterium]|nr:MAG: hypothetical protein DHS20C11_35720 [Xanthomonadaceae bacterium]